MTELMIVSGLVLLICISSSKILYKFGIPMLLIFLVLGTSMLTLTTSPRYDFWIRWYCRNIF